MNLNVARIRIRGGSTIDTIDFHMADGTVRKSCGGAAPNPGFGLEAPFNLRPDEHIVKIEASQQDRLAGLRFYTSHNRTSPWYGTRRGLSREFTASVENPIVGLDRDIAGACVRIARAFLLDGSALEPANPAPRAPRPPGAPVRRRAPRRNFPPRVRSSARTPPVPPPLSSLRCR